MTTVPVLAGEIALVTGALGRLGPVWIGALAGAGARVAAVDLDRAPDNPAFAELQRTHGDAVRLFRADVTSRPSLEQARERIVAEMGAPGILVNNAGIDQPPQPGATATVETVDYEACRRILEVNALGAFQVCQVFGPDLVARGRGTIVNVGSLYASVAPDAKLYDHIPGFLKPPAYGASKAALVNLTRYLATAWGRHGVRVNTLSPGGVLGAQDPEFRRKFCDRVPLGRMAEEGDLVGPLLFLASDASRYVTGAELRVDGGFTAW